MVDVMNVTHPVSRTCNASPCERLDGGTSIAACLKRDLGGGFGLVGDAQRPREALGAA
jgi:hypothetical protein